MQKTHKKALIIGSNGTIGRALVAQLATDYEVHTLSREQTDYTEPSLAEIARDLRSVGEFDLIISCIGVLHNERLQPEKRLAQLNQAGLEEYFRINTIVPSLCIKHFSGLLSKSSNSAFLLLSAMVGSITDNRLGGWYGYRSSKAALNMMVKTASIELARTHKRACIAAVHPGTTMGELSKPFSSRVAKDKYYSPEQTAQRIAALADNLNADSSGHFFNWDGQELAW